MPSENSHFKFIKRSIKALLRFIYPPLCLHCKKLLPEAVDLFCYPCLSLFERIDPISRCPVCFSEDYSNDTRQCGECRLKKQFIYRSAAAFDYMGPAATMIRAIKYGNQPYLTQSAAAFMLEQFIELNWPIPDVIVPVPLAFTHFLMRGYNQSELLSKTFGALLQRPVVNALKRASGDFSQAGLDREQRLQLSGESLKLNKNVFLQDKTILLIDDVYTTGSTMNRCAEVLYSAFPSVIYGLTLCRTVQ